MPHERRYAEKLEKKADLGEIAKATKQAEPKVREWLAVLAKTIQLQDGVWVLELDRVLDASPDELESHREGLVAARRNRLELLSRSTARLLTQMAATVQKANSKVLFHPFDSPSAVKSSNGVATDVLDFRERVGIESSHDADAAKKWGQALAEVRDRVVGSTAEGVSAAGRFGAETFDKATGVFRSIDIDGDGIPDKPRAATAVEDVSATAKKAAANVAGFFKRKPGKGSPVERENEDGAASVPENR